jgi:GTP-binding protein
VIGSSRSGARIPLCAIVGRPNVGKSTLFNRLIGRRRAIVQDDPGVTRDRNYGQADLDGRLLNLVDTGGFEPAASRGIEVLIREQTQLAIEEADLVLLVMDAREGLLASDREVALALRRSGKPTLHVINKVDGPRQEAQAADFYALGVARALTVSAEHGHGLDALVEAVLEALPDAPRAREPVGEDDAEPAPPDSGPRAPGRPNRPDVADDDAAEIRIALVGRPNAGKSSLLNRLVGAERAIVSPEPGTTRDPIDARIEHDAGAFVIVDTAGIRRRRSVSSTMEQYAVVRALAAVSDADAACLLLDAGQPVAEQDAKIAALVIEAGRGLVLACTKADLLPRGDGPRRRLEQEVRAELGFAGFAPLLFLSSTSGAGVGRLLPTVRRVHRAGGRRVQTAELNQFLEQATAAHAPPAFRGHPVRFYYMVQPQVRPPTFLISTNHADGVPLAYRRYLANRLRERYRFEGTPLRLFFRQRSRRDRGD